MYAIAARNDAFRDERIVEYFDQLVAREITGGVKIKWVNAILLGLGEYAIGGEGVEMLYEPFIIRHDLVDFVLRLFYWGNNLKTRRFYSSDEKRFKPFEWAALDTMATPGNSS